MENVLIALRTGRAQARVIRACILDGDRGEPGATGQVPCDRRLGAGGMNYPDTPS